MSKQSQAARIPSRRWTYIIPVAIVMYTLAFLDRNNVSVILPYISQNPHNAINLTSADKGLVSGVFFIGYVVLQIPAAILAERWSAKKTVFILMLLWGATAMATAAVHTRGQFIVMRLLLGLFEGGAWPAVLVLIAKWFPLKERARANGLFAIALPLSSVIMAPLSGIMLDHMSWRAVMFWEGLPPVIWTLVWWFFVADEPKKARWLSATERDYVVGEKAKDLANTPKVESAGYLAALKNSRAWLLALIYFLWLSGQYGFIMWTPDVVKTMTKGSPGLVGWLTAIPYSFGVIGLIVFSIWSDRTRNRRTTVAVPFIIGAAAMVAGQLTHSSALELVFLCVVGVGVYSSFGPWWAVPAETLTPAVLAVSMGLINAIGNLGGFLGPYAVGWLKQRTGSDTSGFYFLAGVLAVAAILTFAVVKNPGKAEAVDSLPETVDPLPGK